MVKTTLRLAALVAISSIGLGSLAATARAQTEPSGEAPTSQPADPSPADPPAGADPAADAEPPANPSEAEPTAVEGAPATDLDPSGGAAIRDTGANPADDLEDSSVGIRELPDQGYWFLGLRFRNFIVPKFMINIFVDGGATVNAFTFGPELTYRRGPLELDIALSYADYSMDPFMFKEKSEPDRAFEKASSDLKLLMASIDIMANIPIDKQGRVSFLVGGDVGVAGVLGNLYRSQAYPAAYDPNNPAVVTADPDRPEQWRECTGPDQPFPVIDNEGKSYCDASNNHYRGYSEASMANGGDLPFIVPYIALPHLALRVKPFKDFQARLDTGFSITGFFFGIGAGYRLPI